MGEPKRPVPLYSFLVATVVYVGLVSCTNGRSREDQPPCCETGDGTEAFPSIELPPISRNRIDSIPETQAVALKDGQLTFAEYESAVLAMARCVRESPLGIEFARIDVDGSVVRIAAPWLDKRGRYQYAFFYPGPVAESEARITFCRQEFLADIENFWVVHVAPSERDLAEARQSLAKCLRASGEEVPVNPSEGDFDRFRNSPTASFRACADSVAEEFALPGFSG